MNPINIAEGWINVAREKLGIADPNVELLAKIRGEICIACPSIGEDLLKCGECGCDVKAKIRSNDKCPLKKW